MIHVKLRLNLKFYNEGNSDIEVEYFENITIMDILNNLDIDPGAVEIILINKRLAEFNDIMEDNDEIELFPMFSGG